MTGWQDMGARGGVQTWRHALARPVGRRRCYYVRRNVDDGYTTSEGSTGYHCRHGILSDASLRELLARLARDEMDLVA